MLQRWKNNDTKDFFDTHDDDLEFWGSTSKEWWVVRYDLWANMPFPLSLASLGKSWIDLQIIEILIDSFLGLSNSRYEFAYDLWVRKGNYQILRFVLWGFITFQFNLMEKDSLLVIVSHNTKLQTTFKHHIQVWLGKLQHERINGVQLFLLLL